LIVVGPGSLYTSLLPNLLVRDLLAAIHSSRAIKIFICNIVTQTGETDEYSCYDHVRALEEHIGEDLFDVVLCNENHSVPLLPGTEWVRADERTMTDARAYCADLLDVEHPSQHDSEKLAQVLMNLFSERTGPLSQ
jgi:uncharacterized cofD-like protein